MEVTEEPTTSADSTESTFDYDASANRISAMLGEEYQGNTTQTEPVETPGLDPAPTVPAPTATAPATPTPPTTYDVPKSWKKEMHAHWGKVAPEAQAYIIEREKQLLDGFSSFRPIQEAIRPYAEYLNGRNMPAHEAINMLLRAQVRLTTGDVEERRRWYKQLGEELQLLDPAQSDGLAAVPIDPAIKSVQDKMSAIEQQLEAQRQASYNAIFEENKKKINAMAADTANYPYFEEVADDMVIFLKQGLSLQDAYAKAVRVNEAVYAKEQARILTEHEAKLKENARLASLPKKQAASVNIKSDRDGPEPTEPLGSLEDTIRSEHKRLKARS